MAVDNRCVPITRSTKEQQATNREINYEQMEEEAEGGGRREGEGKRSETNQAAVCTCTSPHGRVSLLVIPNLY